MTRIHEIETINVISSGSASVSCLTHEYTSGIQQKWSLRYQAQRQVILPQTMYRRGIGVPLMGACHDMQE